MQSQWYNFNAMSPTLFPFAISAVCSFWKDVMSFVSSFWTRIVIVVDSRDTHPSAISSQFLWARDLPLDVVVTTAPNGRCDIMAMATIMRTYINPHLHRMRGLSFNVKSSSCLPLFPRDFHVPAPKLMRLRLECREDDGGNDEHERSLSMPVECQFPVLKTLFIDGRNYYNACSRGGARWRDAVGRIKSLTVSRYKPRSGESLSSHAFALPLTTLEDLRDLQILHVALSSAAQHPWLVNAEPHLSLHPLRYLRLCGLADSRAVGEILDVTTSVSEMDIIRCATALPMNSFGLGGWLELHSIDIKEDLAPLLCTWEGESLVVKKCPGFNDSILEMMCVQEDGDYICAANMEYIDIVDCPNVSVEALKSLVNTLCLPSAEPRLESVRVCGLVPHFSQEDLLWFETNVERFNHWGRLY